MPTSLILISVLLILSCVIAYVSDNMGKKLGKKRISLLGLRPRQTATALTMATSVGIMLVTLAVVMLFNKQVQRAFLRVDKISARNQELHDKNRRLRYESARLNTRLTSLQQSVKQSQNAEREAASRARDATARARNAASQADAARRQLGATRAQLSAARSSLNTAQRAVNQARRGEQVAREQVRGAQKRYADAQERFAQAQRGLAQADRSVAEKQRQIQEAKRNLEAERANLSRAQVNLARAQSTLTRAQTNLGRVQGNLQRVQASVKSTIKDLEVAQTDLEQNRQAVERLRQEVALERTRLTALGAVTEQSWKGRVLVNLGQVFAERILPAGSSQDEIQREVRALIADASRVVEQPPIGARSVSLATRTLPVGEDRTIQLGEQEIIDLLTRYLGTFNVPVALRLAAARNYFEGETELQGLLLPVPVRPAFARGAVLAQSEVAGAQSDARIFNQLLALVNSGERAARERGVTPPLTPVAPNFYAEGTNERIFEALRKIQSRNDTVGVRLIAADNLSTVEPLRVRFEIDSS